jgi:hypothetical protein
VCPDFTNAIVLRQPVPHAISLMAEVKFRYTRQLQLKNITSWTPPAWNLTWWQTLGPALVGNYATRTLVGREGFCRSAANMSSAELAKAADALLGFDMVMTLDRPSEIDLLVSLLLGWPARKFSGQPARRVRTVTQASAPASLGLSLRRLKAEEAAILAAAAVAGGSHGSDAAVGVSGLAEAVGQVQQGSVMSGSASSGNSSSSSDSDSSVVFGMEDEEDEDEGGDEQFNAARMAFEQAAAQFDLPFDEPPPPPALPPEVLELQAAVALVRASWLERQARLLGFRNATCAAAAGALQEPRIEHQEQRSQHGAHIVVVGFDGSEEAWHAFPRHDFAFVEQDMQRLEALTRIDSELFKLADLMLDLDAVWLRAILAHPHYRRKLTRVSATYTACGFAGIVPSSEQAQKLLQL